MKLLVIFVSLVVAISAVSDEQAWANFKETYGKTYKNLREEKLRFDVFKSNLKIINEHNKKYENGEESYDMKANKFSDLTQEEFKKMYLGYRPSKIDFTGHFEPSSNYTAAASIDWRSKGAVLSVKDQKVCESCWSFSAAGALEGQNAIKHGQKVDLSEQELVDCSGSYGNKGCEGGNMDYAFKYVQANGISAASSYPYLGRQGTCSAASKTRTSVKVTGYHDVGASESALQAAVASIGPISVGIASGKIQHYSSGIFDDASCGNAVDHGVLVVGYGSAAKDFWIVKNSWGPSWGESGYIRMVRNKNGQCGITTMVSYPVIA